MKDFFTKNLRLKLISLVLAVSLEIYFVSPHNLVTATLRVVVDITNLPARTMIVSPPKARDGIVTVFKIRGPAPLVQEVLATPRRMAIVLPPNVGESFVTVMSPQELRLPSGVEVLEIDPARVELRLEKVLEKDIPVRVMQHGSLPATLLLDELRPQPEIVRVRGPMNIVSGLEVGDTDRVDLSGIVASQVLDVPLVELGDSVSFHPPSVRVEVKVSPKLGERTVEGVRVKISSPNGVAATVEPSKVRVVVTGDPAVLGPLSDKDIEVTMHTEGLQEGVHDLPVSGICPNGVRFLRAIPERVSVKLVKERR